MRHYSWLAVLSICFTPLWTYKSTLVSVPPLSPLGSMPSFSAMAISPPRLFRGSCPADYEPLNLKAQHRTSRGSSEKALPFLDGCAILAAERAFLGLDFFPLRYFTGPAEALVRNERWPAWVLPLPASFFPLRREDVHSSLGDSESCAGRAELPSFFL